MKRYKEPTREDERTFQSVRTGEKSIVKWVCTYRREKHCEVGKT